MSVQDLPTRTRRRAKRVRKGGKAKRRATRQQPPAPVSLPAKAGKPSGKAAAVSQAVAAKAAAAHLPASTGVRWSKGERLEDLFESLCDTLALSGEDTLPAVIAEGRQYSFRDLDNRANQAARHLQRRGIRPGDRVALLMDKSFDTYVALLAVQKLHAAYVPLDKSFPNDRISFILEDAGVRAIVSQTEFREKISSLAYAKVFIDDEAPQIDKHSTERLKSPKSKRAPDQLSYIIYTSGTTGNPKGVAIDHASICNFVRVAAETYGIRKGDRVYQGMTIAFDFSVEELWVPLMAGATLVPARPGSNLIGEDLADYLRDNRITVMCCVPTLLATIESELPDLRILLVSGEACPHNLVERWYREGRSILNAYGPTEATVTATLTELYPNKPVTIGTALPTYTIVILDENEGKLVDYGGTGEIGIAGIGLARGYLNREELTAQKFISDFVDLPDNPSKRIYRSGDLGRFNDDGEIEYLGRIDTQVKIRGYRIELTEIESLILQNPTVAQAVVNPFEIAPGQLELVAYCSPRSKTADIDRDQIIASLREQLPPYMVPAYLERLDVIPMSSSNKADRKCLPPPTGPRCQVQGKKLAPRTETERLVASALAETLKLPDVSVDDHFFDDLGAHSLLMARFCSAIRDRITAANVSMRDVYANPTVEQLAGKLAAQTADQALASEISTTESTERDEAVYAIPSRVNYLVCGALQLGTYLALSVGLIAAIVTGVQWANEVINDPYQLYQRVLLFMLGLSVFSVFAPVLAKWLLVWRWKPAAMRIWSLNYFRFWFVKLLFDNSVIHLFAGTPLYNMWLRMLGARIGRHAVILSKAPVTTDLFSVGAGSIVRDNTVMQGYRARNNVIETGSISIGSDAYIDTGSHLDIDTVVEDGGQLAHSSTLQQGQVIPADRHYHGTPAEETSTDFNTVAPKRCSSLRRWAYGGLVAAANMVVSPIPIVFLFYSYSILHSYSGAQDLNYDNLSGVITALAPMGLWISLLIYSGMTMLGFIFLRVVPPLLNRLLKADRTYVLFGFHYAVQRLIQVSTNWGHMNLLFGDSSCITKYLELVGWKLAPGKQTGSNFGLDQVHDNPYLCHVGANSMISDGIAMSNMELSATSFKLADVKVGADNYLGNAIIMPSGSRTGDNVLIGSKTMVPIDGPLRENTGLLGSPAFEIPRSTEPDKQASQTEDPEIFRNNLARKNRWNLASMLAIFTAHWFVSFVGVFVMFVSILYYDLYAMSAILAGSFTVMAFVIAFFTLLERASLGFDGLQARTVTMYDPYFLFHERHWKFCGHPLNMLFHGTPFRNLMSRALGVRVGKMVFDDGANLYDKTLLEIGDYSTLNKACILQAHSLEEGLFKSEPVRIGSQCTISADAFVHYGVNMGNRATLGPNAFLMKGENVPAGQTWQGNPASLAPAQSPALATFDRRSRGNAATARKRLDDKNRKDRSRSPRQLPQANPETTDATQDYRDVLQRQVIVSTILAPVNTSKMFNGQRTG
ncbi:MAG: Pls/PosA family non-ribosomal peptide synthetase [Anderseniella sp.]